MTADGGGDFPEAYNRTFFEAYSDAGYSAPVAAGGRDPLASQFLVVLGDAAPHSATGFRLVPRCAAGRLRSRRRHPAVATT